MKRLPVPVRDILTDRVDDVAEARVLRGWRLKRDARHARTQQTVAVMAAAAAVVAVVVITRTPSVEGPLLRADGVVPRALAAEGDTATQVTMQDGSRLAVQRGSLVVTGNHARAFSTRLEGERAHFEITPGGPRRWSVLCESVLVEVTGTVFDVEREPGAVRISVTRGSVRVSGPRVPGSSRSLVAGTSLRVLLAEGPPPPAPEPPQRTLPPPAVSAHVPAPIARPRTPDATVLGWREFARQGDYARAYHELGADGIARVEPTLSADALLALADVARLSGHPTEAVSPLERVLREHAGDPVAPLAAFALGRLELDALRRPARAVDALSRALSLGVPRSLEDDVRARLVEACDAAGDRACVRREAEAYLQRFPDGRRAAMVRRAAEMP
jgi:transmembrane sensor